MGIFEQSYLLEFFGKKEKQNRKIDFEEGDVDKITKALKQIISKYNSDQSIKNEIKDRELKFKRFICDVFEEYSNEIIYEVCSNDQDYIVEIEDIIRKICDDLKNKLNDNTFSYSTGDGDEGLITVTKK